MAKIVGTIGPVSEDFPTLQKLVHEGLRIMRMNFSHATYEEATLRMTNLRQCKGLHALQGKENNLFNARSVLLDTQGPEIRAGSFEAPTKSMGLKTNEFITLTTDKAYETKSTSEMLYVNYDKMPQTVSEGDSILLDDGLIHLIVQSIDTTLGQMVCQIQNGETLGNRKGVNLPGLVVDLPAMTTKDQRDIEFGVKHDVDFVAASFVRTAADVIQIKKFIAEMQLKHRPTEVSTPPLVISKIENLEGLQNFDDILALSDGIMVARGDLGVEIPLEQVLVAQKEMVSKSNAAGKPVIVATQMLESMMKNPRPTRAEVSDVGNAVYDGADAVMLSGEVAQGKYPVESVQMMRRIVKQAENVHVKSQCGMSTAYSCTTMDDMEAMARAVVQSASELDATLIIVLTDSGSTARMVAKCRPTVPVMCFAACQKVARQLQLHRGLFPVVSDTATTHRPTAEQAIRQAKTMGWLTSGNKVVLLNAESLSDHLGTQIMMRVASVQ